MWQYPRLYGCRIPGQQVDTWRQNGLPKQRHVIIMRKGHVSHVTFNLFLLFSIQLLLL